MDISHLIATRPTQRRHLGAWYSELIDAAEREGLSLLAAERFGVDLARSFTVGDSLRDLEAGAALGVRGILVRTGKGAAEEHRARATGRDVVAVDDLEAAAEWLLGAAR